MQDILYLIGFFIVLAAASLFVTGIVEVAGALI